MLIVFLFLWLGKFTQAPNESLTHEFKMLFERDFLPLVS